MVESSVNIDTELVMAVSGRSSPVQLPPMASYLRARAGRGPGGVAPLARRQSLLPYRVTPNKMAMCLGRHHSPRCHRDGCVSPARYTPCIGRGEGELSQERLCTHRARNDRVIRANLHCASFLGRDKMADIRMCPTLDNFMINAMSFTISPHRWLHTTCPG